MVSSQALLRKMTLAEDFDLDAVLAGCLDRGYTGADLYALCADASLQGGGFFVCVFFVFYSVANTELQGFGD